MILHKRVFVYYNVSHTVKFAVSGNVIYFILGEAFSCVWLQEAKKLISFLEAKKAGYDNANQKRLYLRHICPRKLNLAEE